MIKKLLFLFVSITLSLTGFSQIGGQNTYDFMTLPSSPRISALGGHLISVIDDDVSLAYANPGLLNPLMHQKLTINQAFHVAGIKFGYAGYGHYVPKWKTTFHGGIQYANYGTIDATDITGLVTGTFKAKEFAITAGGAYQWQEKLRVGANVKLITSRFESYNSVGISSDWAVVYVDTAKRLTLTILAKNIGTQLSTYTEGNQERLPFEMQIGLSKRLRHLPFRFSVVYRYFDKWNILYDDPNAEDQVLFLGEQQQEASDVSVILDNLLRHFVISGEFLLGKSENLRLRFGYSQLQQKEMSIDNYRSLSGFSVGFGIKVKRFKLDYGRTNFHLGKTVNFIGISTKLGPFKKRRRVVRSLG